MKADRYYYQKVRTEHIAVGDRVLIRGHVAEVTRVSRAMSIVIYQVTMLTGPDAGASEKISLYHTGLVSKVCPPLFAYSETAWIFSGGIT
jgi:hypothetical protein